MDKTEALILITKLVRATIRNYEVVNGYARGSSDRAADEEVKHARKLLNAMGIKDATNEEINMALFG